VYRFSRPAAQTFDFAPKFISDIPLFCGSIVYGYPHRSKSELAPKVKAPLRMVKRYVNAAIIGEQACGKTSAIMRYLNSARPSSYIETIFDAYSYIVDISEERSISCKKTSTDVENLNYNVYVRLVDVGGCEHRRNLAKYCVKDADVYICAYSVMSQPSFKRVENEWIPFIRQRQPDAKILLVGCKSDARNNERLKIILASRNISMVSQCQALSLVDSLSLDGFLECSAETRSGIDALFRRVASLGVSKTDGKKTPKSKRDYPRTSKEISSNSATPRSKVGKKRNSFSSCDYTYRSNDSPRPSSSTSRRRSWISKLFSCFTADSHIEYRKEATAVAFGKRTPRMAASKALPSRSSLMVTPIKLVGSQTSLLVSPLDLPETKQGSSIPMLNLETPSKK